MGAVTAAGEHFVPRSTATDPFDRSEDAFDVYRPVGCGLLGMGNDHLLEISISLGRRRRHHPQLEKVFEVAEPVELGELLFIVRREGVPIARRHLEGILRADGCFQVNV